MYCVLYSYLKNTIQYLCTVDEEFWFSSVCGWSLELGYGVHEWGPVRRLGWSVWDKGASAVAWRFRPNRLERCERWTTLIQGRQISARSQWTSAPLMIVWVWFFSVSFCLLLFLFFVCTLKKCFTWICVMTGKIWCQFVLATSRHT